jgi:molybdenum cofactor cytidylyltransferase
MTPVKDITAVLLAAGLSRRFGSRDKLLETLDGVPLALHAAQRIVDFSPARRCAVCASADGPVADGLRALGFEIIVNADPAAGLSRSLALGIYAATGHATSATLVCLGDMPFISTPHLEAMLERFDAHDAPAVASVLGSQPMPPALFGRSHYSELMALTGDHGARNLLKRAVLVPCAPQQLADIDRPEDLPN